MTTYANNNIININSISGSKYKNTLVFSLFEKFEYSLKFHCSFNSGGLPLHICPTFHYYSGYCKFYNGFVCWAKTQQVAGSRIMQ